MFLRITTLTDIAHSDGRPLKKIWEVQKGIQTISTTAYTWPIQGEASQEAKQLWKAMLQRLFNLEKGQPKPLMRSKGINTSAASAAAWMFDTQTDTLWKKDTHLWQQWKQHNQRTRTSKRTFKSNNTLVTMKTTQSENKNKQTDI